ncbi:MAG TPA: membrane protein insertion efficiency factor YidD [Streptosporangiaceae bacterium]|jgi:putative component of membrane protein insertase Oxa1/YidC/SpoIIIJ protein YidD
MANRGNGRVTGGSYGSKGAAVRALIRAYQLWVPARFKGNCPNVPHCSEYGLRSVALNGTVSGGLMALRRVASCGAIATVLSLNELASADSGWHDVCCGFEAGPNCPCESASILGRLAGLSVGRPAR